MGECAPLRTLVTPEPPVPLIGISRAIPTFPYGHRPTAVDDTLHYTYSITEAYLKVAAGTLAAK